MKHKFRETPVIEEKTEKIYVEGPYFPNNSYIVRRHITTGDCLSKVKILSRPSKKKAEIFAVALAKKRNIEYGGLIPAGFYEQEPIR